MVEIIDRNNKILRKECKEVPVHEITEKKVRTIISNMIESLESQADGVAIAAPQIGEPYRIFVVSGKILNLNSKKDKVSEKPLVFINPKILKTSKEKQSMHEGCLSIRYLYGMVRRAKKATIEAYDENGKKIVRGGSTLLAQIFQHEIDHLNGILFTDKATNVENIPPDLEPVAGPHP